MPNSSARCAQLPRAVDKVPFYQALKKFRDYLKGSIDKIEDSEVVFSNVKLKNFNEGNPLKKEMNSEFKVSDGSSDQGDMDFRLDPLTGKKRRGRPPKPRPDGTIPPPKRRTVDADGNPIPRGTNPIDPLTGKKKRGRPKKADLPPGVSPPPRKPKKPKSENPVLGGQMASNTFSINNKPTKVVPPLPPFSPNFGIPHGEEKPNDLKGHNDHLARGNYHNMPPNSMPCDYNSDRPPPHHIPEGYPPGGNNFHYPPHHPTPLHHNGTNYHYNSSSAAAPPNTNSSSNQQLKSTTTNDDVTTKSITGLESLVDQIPALPHENDSGVFSSGSHPNTPRSVGPYSPAPTASQFPSGGSGGAANSNYGTGESTPATYNVPSTSNSMESTNYAPPSTVTSGTPTDFSVNSLVHNSSSSSSAPAPTPSESSDPFSVSSLTSKYPGLPTTSSNPPGSGYGGVFPPTSFGAGGFLSGHNSLPSGHHPAMSPMGAMGMSYYGQYPNPPYGGSAAGFGASPYPPGLHMPNPSYPYPSPYGQSPYSQTPYF